MTTKRKPSAPCGNVSTVGNLPSPNAAEPLLERRGIKYAAFASDETSCYSATLYVDGRKFCEVSNDGNGGCDNHYPVKGGIAPRDLNDALWELAKRINPQAVRTWNDLPGRDPKTGALVSEVPADHVEPVDYWAHGPQTLDTILEGVCGHLLTDHLIARDLARDFKKRVVFTLPDGRLMECKLRGNPVAAVIAAVKLRNPGAVILNEKPMAEAVAIMRARDPR
jgi:hypothetical protein